MGKPGFTLIELLIVLVIIGIIVTLAIPNYESYIRNVQAVEAKTVLRKLSDACVNFYTESGRWPTEAEGFAALDIQPPTSKYFTYTYSLRVFPAATFQSVAAQYKDIDLLKQGSVRAYIIQHYDQPRHYGEIGQPVGNGWYRYYFCYKKGSAALYDWDGNRINFL